MQMVEIYGYMIRGLGGVINWLERITMDKHVINDHWLGELRKCRTQLDNIIKAQEVFQR